ncbi:hypothetical protein [Clostridium sp. VAP52]|uniref:hypothetical protein n=1 Tax=Clostridium sp. VAP52 TaxID=2949977 RepID=UPI002079C6D5|nr:hypothetical protein [Clostridium sp. VAP52]
MKIKPLMLNKEDVEKGFKCDIEYEVDKINVSGDCQAYDVWFHVTNDKNNELWIQDLYDTNVVPRDITSLLNSIYDMVCTYYKIPFKFNFDIDVDEE